MIIRLCCLMALVLIAQGCTTTQTTHETNALFNTSSRVRADNLGHRANSDYHYLQMVMDYPATDPDTGSARDGAPASATPEHVTQTEGYSSNLAWLDSYLTPETDRHRHHRDSKIRISNRPLGSLPPTPGAGAVGDTGSLGESSVDQSANEHETYQPTTFVQ